MTLLVLSAAGFGCDAPTQEAPPEEAAWVWEGLDATAVATNGSDVCALDRDGIAACIGLESSGITEPPAKPLRTVELAQYSACGLTYDGTITCWGCGYHETPDGTQSLDEGQCLAPEGEFADLTVAMWRACAVAPDETARCWGRPLENGAGNSITQGIVDLSYDSFLCAVRTDGLLRCWSDLDDAPQPPDGVFLQVNVGNGQACAEPAAGGITCWGEWGNLPAMSSSVDLLDFDVGDVSVCLIRTLDAAIECEGRMAAWPTPAGRYVDVAVGGDRAYAVREDGLLVGWGDFSPADTGTVD